MKVLMSTPYFAPKIGGLENYALQLALALRADGHEVSIVTSNHVTKEATLDTVDGLTVYRLPIFFKLFNTPINPFWIGSLRTIIKAQHPDVIMTHSPVPTMADATVLAAGKTPVILFYHAASLIKKDAPIFNTIARLYGLVQSLTFARTTVIAGVSQFVVDGLPARARAKAVVVPNAVWHSEVNRGTKIPEANEIVFIASLDRTHSWKGLSEIIDALALYKERFGTAPHLNVIGDGDYRTVYEAKTKTLGLADFVTFLGAQRGAQKNAVVTRARALVCYPTTSNDAFPTVMLEAWANHTVVVAASIGPIPSLIHDKRDGILIAPNDPAALATALNDVVTMSTSAVAAMTKAAATRVRNDYTWEAQAKLVGTIMEGLL